MIRDKTSRVIYYFLQAVLVIILFYLEDLVSSNEYKPVFLGLIAVIIFVLYRFDFELFILFTLIVNHELFYLASREPLLTANYQDTLLFLLPMTLVAFFFRRVEVHRGIMMLIFAFLVIIFLAVFNSFQQGQPFMLGVKAAKGYFFILFYFVFASKPINVPRLTKFIVLAGVLLMVLNNIQYLGWETLRLFQYGREVDLERGGYLRFLMGDFFTIFAPILALGVYLQQKKGWYLAAFLYMIVTVVVQGQTRAVIFGFVMTVLVLLYFSRHIRLKAFFAVFSLIIAAYLFEPILQKSFLGNLFQETFWEFAMQTGNVGVRFDTYDYYWSELSQNIITGRGIWNDLFTEYNPEDLKSSGIHLSDAGMLGFFFHTGIFGFAWLSMFLYYIYRIHFESVGKLRTGINYGILGYFIFGISTVATLNCLTGRYTIIYLALALAIISQYPSLSDKEAGTGSPVS